VLARLAFPALLLGGAFFLVFFSEGIPPSLAGLKVYGPYIVLAAGAALAVASNRGRALFALATLAAAYEVQQDFLQAGLEAPGARAAYLALTVFVPLNLALFALLPERGIFNRHGAARAAVIVAELALVGWIISSGRDDLVAWAAQKFFADAPGIGAMPQAGIAAAAIALLVTVAAAVLSRSAINTSCAGAIVAFVVGAHVPAASFTFAVFIAAAALMVTIAVLQDTFRMAFRDELTGLPARRALNERLATLGRRYVIAMLDVDHFKAFNDTYGHDLGDQVLKMVATQIEDVGCGGRAYRYGGEEFTVVFPRKSIAVAVPYLEALRKRIEEYQVAVRAPDRPPKAKAKGRQRQRGGWRSGTSVSVTISIGIAERNERLTSPDAVMEAADRALYRAKERGRNRLER
jgi:GGDEF domain-containing protein